MRNTRPGHQQRALVKIRLRPAVLRIAARGDMTNDARVLEFNRTCIQSICRPPHRLVLELAGVTRSDTKLIAVLISLYANCRRRRIELEMRLSPAIINWLAIYDLKWIVDVCTPADVA